MRTTRFRPTSSKRRRKDRACDIMPFIEAFEERCLMTGFLQGTVVDSSNSPVQYATVDLYNSSSVLVGTVVTPADGYYQFNNLAAGNYQLVEMPPAGYTNSSTSADSPLNPILAGGTASTVNVQVTDVTDPAPNNFTSVAFNSTNFYNENGSKPLQFTFQVNKNYANGKTASYVGVQLYAAQLPITATYTGTPGFTTPLFSSYCVDPLQSLKGDDNFPVQGAELPTALDVPSAGIVNSGRIAYLYNTYGSSPSVLSDPEMMAGLQLALWKLEFDPESGTATAADFTTGNIDNFAPVTGFATAAQLTASINDAVTFINDSSGQNQLAVYLQTNGLPASGGEQGVIGSSVINFTNTPSPTATPQITTNATQTAGGVVGTAVLSDSATLTGTYNGTGGGSITFTLTEPNGTVVTEGPVAVTGDGTYNAPTPVTATQVGTYTWQASYSGDSLDSGAVDNGANESVTTVKASPTIATVATASPSLVVGTASLSDAATISGGYNVSGGSITFTLTEPNGTIVTEGPVAVIGDGTYNAPTPVTATQVGTYTWLATYTGDGLNNGAIDNGANESLTTVKASPTIATVASASPSLVVGTAQLSDAATISGGYNVSGGSITFTLTEPDGTVITEGPVAVSGDGTYNAPTPVAATQVGTYTWLATYTGDGLNNGAIDDGTNESVTTVPASPTIATVATASPSLVVGTASLSDAATISGGYNVSGGSITFTLTEPDGTVITEGPVAVSGDGTYNAPTPVTATQVGTYTWLATYTGDGLNNGAIDDGTNESLTTVKASPTIATVATASPSLVVGTASLSDAATISGGYNVSGGSITFTLTEPDGTIVTEGPVAVSGDGTYNAPTPVTATQVGTYTWLATYTGDGLNNGAIDDGTNESLTTVKASPTIATVATASPSLVVGTASLSDAATISGGYNVSGGSITFTLTEPNGTIVTEGPVAVSGDGTYNAPTPVTATQVGTYTWLATYTGDGLNNGAIDDGTNESLTTVKASPTIATVATASPSLVVGTASLSDAATISGGYNVSGGSITFTLTEPNGAVITEGPVAVSGDGTYNAPTPVTATQVGTYTWLATYTGDGLNNGAIDDGTNESLTTVKASPTIATVATASPSLVVGTASLSDAATISGGYNVSGGSITFTLTEPNGAVITEGPVAVSGDGTYNAPTPVTATQVGTYTWLATYTGDGLNNGAIDNGANESLTTVKASPTIVTVATASPSLVVGTASLSDAATISGGYNVSGGSITFTLTEPNGAVITEGPVAVSGDGTYNAPTPVTATQVGTYTWLATYTGDGLNNGAIDDGSNESLTTVEASPTIVTVATASPSLVVGTAVLSDAATISGGYNVSGGSITFTLTEPNGTIVTEGPVAVSGDGTYNAPTPVTATQVGTYTWLATYTGDGLNNGAIDDGTNESLTTVKASPTIATVATASPSLVVGTASLSDAATISGGYNVSGGSITFTLTEPNGAVITEGPVAVSGDGTYNAPTPVTATQVGTYTWLATYTGDGLNNGAIDDGTNESVTTVPASPTIATVATASPSLVVGTASLSDAATISGGYNVSGGSITFTLTEPNGTIVTEGPVAVSGDGTYNAPTPVTATQVGTYTWLATYTGDGLNNGAIDNGANESLTTVKASPTIATVATASPSLVVGTASLSDAATISGGYNVSGGSITFTLTEPNGTIVTEGPVAVSGDGTYNAPTPVTATQVGTYTWLATYTGDGLNNGAIDNGANESLTTVQAGPSITTTPSMTTSTSSGAVIAGEFATIGFWHNQNGQAVINSFNGSSSSTALGNWLASNYPNLFGASNPYTGTSLAGLTNAQVATVYENLWTPSGLQKNTYVQAFAVALGLYADTTSLGGQSLINNGLAAKYGFVVTASGAGTFNIGSNGSAFGASNGTSLSVLNILTVANSDFSPSTGLFYGGDQTNTSAANNVLNGINSVGDIPGSSSNLTSNSTNVLNDSAMLSNGYNPTGTITFYLMAPGSTSSTPLTSAVYTDAVTISGNGTYTTASGNNPGGYVPTTTGAYEWVAVYSGDTNNSTFTSPFGSEPWNVGAAAPTINTIPGGTVVIGSGTKLTDSAMLAAGVNPAGTITFYLMAPGSTSSTPLTSAVYTDAVTISGDGTYTTAAGNNPGGYLPATTGTYQWVAIYSGDTNNNGATSAFGDEPETVGSAGPTLVTTAGGTVALGGITISGTKYLDLTGDGFSTDDTPLGGVTINLYLSTNGSSGLQTGSGGDQLIATTTTASNGTYSFSVSTPGTYYVQESVPSGDLQTGGGPNGSAGNSYYTISVTAGHSYSGYNFDDFQTTNCNCGSSFNFTVTTPKGVVTHPTSLGGNTAQGDTVTVALPSGSSQQYTLVVYTAPGSSFSDSTAYLQSIYSQATGSYTGGNHTLTVTIPSTYYQIDFVCGSAINELEPNQYNDEYGPDSANVLYTPQGRLITSDNGGTTAPSPLPTPTPTLPPVTSSSTPTTPLSDSAVLSSGYNPTGTIVFYLFAPGTTANYSGTGSVFSDSVTVSGNATYSTSSGTTTGSAVPTVAGTYQWVAVYSGDTNNSGAHDQGGTSEQETVTGPASPSISTKPSTTSTQCSNSTVLTDTATLSGGSNPTGTIIFTLYNPSGTLVDTETVTVKGDGSYKTPNGYTLPTTGNVTGTYQWDATYSGDANNNSVSDVNDAAEQITIGSASPSISTKPSVTSTQCSTSTVLKDTATLSGGDNPTGTITFTLYNPSGTLVDTETASVNGDGSYATPTGYTLPTKGTVTGTYQWDAKYNGDGNNSPVSDINNPNEQVTIGKSSLTLFTTPSPTIVQGGTATKLTDTATLSGGFGETGTITFTLYSPSNKLLDTETISVNGDGTYTTPTGYSLPANAAAGIYQWDATYTGDGNNIAATDNNDAGEQVMVVSPCCNVQNLSFSVYNPTTKKTTTVSDLRGNTAQGDTVTATFTVPSGYYDQISLVSYIAPQSYYSQTSAYLQAVSTVATGTFGPGTHSLQVTLPCSDYQVDLICGTAIAQLGLSPDDFYSAQGRLLSADNEGTSVPSSLSGSAVGADQTAATSFWTASDGQALIKSLNSGASDTSLGNWLATVSPNLFGGLAGDTNTQVASYVKTLSGATAQVMATSLSMYVTDSTLAGGTVASSYHFKVTTTGSGIDTYNVGSNGSAIGLSNSTSYSLVTLLASADSAASGGFTTAEANAVTAIFTAINTAGTIKNAALSDAGLAYTPAQIRAAYGISSLSEDGTGQTIAIVEAYDDPNILASVDAFDGQFGLTDSGPTLYDQYGAASSFLTVVNESGQTSPLPATDPSGAGTDNWEVEAALDVEWAHAMAPGAQIVLVEASSQSLSDLMTGVATAAAQPGVSVVTMSWGLPEGQSVFAADEANYDPVFNVPGVTFLASTGDYGTSDPEYPAFSPNVVAVGGTSLTLNADSSYNSETGWGYYSNSVGAAIGSGGGLSAYEPEPSFQQGVQSTGSRTTPDVSMDADPATGAWIADSYNLDPSNPFEVVGGTSLSAPAFAGLVALVNQGREAAGEAVLNSASPTETQQALYGLPQADYNSITSGSNGYTANAGYNLVTGLGTPVANLMVPDLIDYQGPGTTYAGPTVGPLLDATLDGSWAGGGGGVTNAFNVFSALTMGSGGFAGQAQASAAGMPISGTSATVVASHAVTTTPMSAVTSTFGPATGHVSTGVSSSVIGWATNSGAAGVLSQPGSGAMIAPASNGHATATVAWSAVQSGVSTPITYGQPSGSSTTVGENSDVLIAARSRMGLVADSVLDELAADSTLWQRQQWDGTVTIPVLPSDSVLGVAVPTDPSVRQDRLRSPAAFAERLAIFGLAAGLFGGAGIVNSRKRRSADPSLDRKPLPSRPNRD